MTHEVILTAADANRRLDKYLAQYLNKAPRALLYKLLRKKRIKLNGRRAAGGEITAAGDTVVFYLSPAVLDGLTAERAVPVSSAALDITYEDGHMLLLNKPAGLLSHPGDTGRGGAGGDTLIARALFYLKQTGAYDSSKQATFTPALCNRLDRNTSGLVVCGKTLAAVQGLTALFAGRNAEKIYLAVAHGTLAGRGALEGYWAKDGRGNTARVVPADGGANTPGLYVKTLYEAAAHGNGYTLLWVRPVTGRSHQIRAQLAAAGHPLAGDFKYGGRPAPYAPAQLLHCYGLSFHAGTENLPYGPDSYWTAPPPAGFAKCVKDWFNYEGDYFSGGIRDPHVPLDPGPPQGAAAAGGPAGH